jgi:hypothetical protein
MVYQYTAAASEPTAPFATPDMGGKGQFGNCVDERSTGANSAPTWPFRAISNATYLDLPKVQLKGPGIATTLDITKTNPPNTGGNSTFRKYGFTYGGGAPGNPAPAGFNGTITAAVSVGGGEYTLDIGKGAPMTYDIPEAFTAPLGIGGAATVMIPAHHDLEFSWTTPKNDKGTDGLQHTKKTYFNFTFFADPTNTGHEPQFICFPDVDGHTLIPTAVIDALPATGLIVNANLGHWMDVRDTMGGEQRRFDLVSIYCNISSYSKQ